MNATSPHSTGQESTEPLSSPYSSPIAAAVASCAIITLGFFGLKVLMHERPEFMGQSGEVSKAVLVQESPRIVVRKASDDVSVIKSAQPASSDIHLSMHGRRDYRGLKTLSDMSGQFMARYTLTNSADEPLFVLFKCQHPRAEDTEGQNVPAGSLSLKASVAGTQETATNAWLWSGTIPTHTTAMIEVGYQAASLKGIRYLFAPADGTPINEARVTFERLDLPSMRFESADGTIATNSDSVRWERKDFLGPDFFSAGIVETRNLFSSLSQLVEIGPLISILFLVAVIAGLLVRQKLTAVQVLTISAGYALYFPLILYLSSRFSFGVALVLAVLIPGALLLNYARWLVGGRLGLIGGPLFLLIYQVFPTLAVFAGWNRGMILLGLGVVTLWVLINLQNQALRRKVPATAIFLALALPWAALSAEQSDAAQSKPVPSPELKREASEPGRGGERWRTRNFSDPELRRYLEQLGWPAMFESNRNKPTEKLVPLVAFEPARDELHQRPMFFEVKAEVPFQVIKAGDIPLLLFAGPVYLQDSQLEPAGTNLAQVLTFSNRLHLCVFRTGKGTLSLSYRVPVEKREGKQSAQIPVLPVPGNIRLESPRNNLEVLSGSFWNRISTDNVTSYELGVAGQDTLNLEWREATPSKESVAAIGNQASPSNAVAAASASPVPAVESPTNDSRAFYGIGLTRAQNLTVINSDGSCTHFAEYEVPAFQKEEFRLRLPAGARLVSASIDGTEINAPDVNEGLCRLQLPWSNTRQQAHHVSIRLAFAAARLGFAGSLEFALPEVFQAAGLLEWVVALPDGFETQVISSSLETEKTAPELTPFGDYGRVLRTRHLTFLAKTLAPPGPTGLSLKYRQIIPGW